MSFASVSGRYGVPAYRGRRVRCGGDLGTILSAPGHYIRIRFDGEPAPRGKHHPLWHMDYLDGIDHARRYDERVESAFPSSRAK